MGTLTLDSGHFVEAASAKLVVIYSVSQITLNECIKRVQIKIFFFRYQNSFMFSSKNNFQQCGPFLKVWVCE